MYALAGEGRTNGVFKFLYVINASSILIEYVSKCLARHHIREIRERKKALSSHGHTIAQTTQIFMLAATLFQVPLKSPHIREIRERKKHSAVMGTQIHRSHRFSCCWLLSLGVCIAVSEGC